ncbi:replication/maintenance protein RepL [Pedococcus soli]
MPEYANVETGEIHLVGIVKRPRHTETFSLLFQKPLLHLLSDKELRLSALDWKLLLLLLSSMEYENTLDAHISELAEGIGHERSAVSKALTKLERAGLIKRQDMGGTRPRRILVDPALVFRGTFGQRAAALKVYDAAA